jgi:predicted patatin/cPLA2 family phospholipase
MFLEITTLLVLLGVLLAKYGTARHTNLLSLEYRNLDKLCQQIRERYQLLYDRRGAIELEEKNVRRDRIALETLQENLEKALQKQNEKNNELESQLR